MDGQRKLEILKVLNLLKIAFPYIVRERTAEQLTQFTDLYCELLEEVDIDQLKIAARQIAVDSKYFPTIAELREKVLALSETASETPDYTQAWDEVMREVRRVGYESWVSACFSTPLIREVAKTFWRDACLGDMDNLPTVRAQFRDVYNVRVRRTQEQKRMLPATRQMIKELAERLDISRRLLSGGDNGDGIQHEVEL